MGTIRNMLYDSTDINWTARERAEMLSVRPAPPERIPGLKRDKAAFIGVVFCLLMLVLLGVTWVMM